MTRPVEPTAASETEMIGGFKVHPAANLLPAPTPEEYERLKIDIKEHGLRVPIVITDDGQILDGRTRAQICNELGIDHTSRPANPHRRGATNDEMDDPVGTVLSLNAARRHLSATKIVEIYLEANKTKIEIDQQAAKAAQQAGLKRGTARGITNADLIEANQKALAAQQTSLKKGTARGVNTTPTGKTAARIAQATGVSESTVKNVLRNKKAASEGASTKPAQGNKKTTAGKAPVNKTDWWEGVIRYETPEERRDVVEMLDKAFEFINCGDIRLEVLNDFEDIYALEDHLDELEVLLEEPPFSSFRVALTAIEMGAMCLTPVHIKTLTKWRDRIDAILQKAEVKPEPAVPEAAGGPVEIEPRPTRAQGAAPAAAEP